MIPGFWESLQAGLPEPIAAAALLGGVLCVSQHRWWLAALLFALSLLVRETGIIAIGCVLLAALLEDRRREIIFVGIFAVSAFVLWRLYVAWVLFPDWGIEGFFTHPADLGCTFAGFLDLWRMIARGQYYPGQFDMSRAGIVYPLRFTGGFALAAALAVTAPNPVNMAALVRAHRDQLELQTDLGTRR